jgi:hypothetical protein
MERAKLKGFGLTDEQINEIMNDHGAVVNAAKNGMTDLQAKVTTLEGQLAAHADYDAIKSELETFRAGQPEVDKELKELREYKTGREYGDRFTAATGDKKWVNDVTREHAFGLFTAAVADPANEGKTDSDIFASVTEGKDAEWFSSKVGIVMTPSNPHADPNQHTSSVKLIPHTN